MINISDHVRHEKAGKLLLFCLEIGEVREEIGEVREEIGEVREETGEE